jgi:hypothetical protein
MPTPATTLLAGQFNANLERGIAFRAADCQ